MNVQKQAAHNHFEHLGTRNWAVPTGTCSKAFFDLFRLGFHPMHSRMIQMFFHLPRQLKNPINVCPGVGKHIKAPAWLMSQPPSKKKGMMSAQCVVEICTTCAS